MNERIEGRKNYPTDEIDPENFISDEEVKRMVENKDGFKFTQDDYEKVYNCVNCGECETEEQRIELKTKFLKDGNTLEGLEAMIENFEKFRTPYPQNKMRIRPPEGIPENSETLFFMGCLSTIRIPKYTNNALKYLLKSGIDFTILDTEICCGWPWFSSGSMREYEICIEENVEVLRKFKNVICLCPVCYYFFKTYVSPKLEGKVKFDFIIDYLKPSDIKKEGKVGVQHLCQLKNRGRKDVDNVFNDILEKSGYNVQNVPHWCCGGGLGYQHRTDIIDAVAKKRMSDFNREDIDYITTYCVSCWWILSRFSRKEKIHPKAMDPFELLL